MPPILHPPDVPSLYDRVFEGDQDGEGALYAAALEGFARSARVLDLGCGTGRLGLILRDVIPHARVTSCDLQSAWLSRAGARGLRDLVCANAINLPFADAVFAGCTSGLLVLNYMGSADAFTAGMCEAARVMSPSGILIADILCAHQPKRLQGMRESFATDDSSGAGFAFEFYDVLGDEARGATLASAMILGADGELAIERANVFVPALGALEAMLGTAGLKIEWLAPPYDFEERTLQPPEDCLRAVVCARRDLESRSSVLAG